MVRADNNGEVVWVINEVLSSVNWLWLVSDYDIRWSYVPHANFSVHSWNMSSCVTAAESATHRRKCTFPCSFHRHGDPSGPCEMVSEETLPSFLKTDLIP